MLGVPNTHPAARSFNGENCTTVQTNLINLMCPGCGSSTDTTPTPPRVLPATFREILVEGIFPVAMLSSSPPVPSTRMVVMTKVTTVDGPRAVLNSITTTDPLSGKAVTPDCLSAFHASADT